MCAQVFDSSAFRLDWNIMTRPFGPGYMNSRKREEVVDLAFETVLVCLRDADRDDYERIRAGINVIEDYQRFISYHQKLDQRKERLANAKRAQG